MTIAKAGFTVSGFDLSCALPNGVTRAEVQKILLQVTIHGGVPTGGEALEVAREVFAEPEFAA